MAVARSCLPTRVIAFMTVLLLMMLPLHAKAGSDDKDDEEKAIVYSQVNPEVAVTSLYPIHSDVSMAIMAVPDPRVPRHRPQYDLAMVAAIHGMLDAGYALDRYSFPWQDQMDGNNKGERVVDTDNCRFGLMLFRRDDWRLGPNETKGKNTFAVPDARRQPASIRALYIVPETNTYGLPSGTLQLAMSMIAAQQGKAVDVGFLASQCPRRVGKKNALPSFDELRAGPPARSAKHWTCHNAGHRMLMLGPNFSGSVDSLLQVSKAWDRSLPLCALSASATAFTNQDWKRLGDTYAQGWDTLSVAVSDEKRLAMLWDMSKALRAEEGRIVLLGEATVFGHEMCSRSERTPKEVCRRGGERMNTRARRDCLCRNAVRISFPANIADVRTALAEKSAGRSDGGINKLMGAGRISLQEGVGNGSEYPDSQQAQHTAVATYLQVQRTMRAIRAVRPAMVIVAATDVRDRLFLFDLLQQQSGGVQLVDMEADSMLAHPDHQHAGRGVIAFSSLALAEKRGSQVDVSSNDRQALLKGLVRCLDKSSCNFTTAGDPLLNVVVRNGVSPIRVEWFRKDTFPSMKYVVPILVIVGLAFFCLSSPALRQFVLVPSKGSIAYRMHERLRAKIGWEDPTINPSFVLMTLGMLVMLSATLLVVERMTVVVAVLAVPLFWWANSYQVGLHYLNWTGRLAHQSRAKRVLRWAARHLLFLLAVVMVIWMVVLHLTIAPEGKAAAMLLGYRVYLGMAPFAAVALAVMMLLFADSCLSVARNSSRRGQAVLVWTLAAFHESELTRQIKSAFVVGLRPRSALWVVGIIALTLCASVGVLPIRTSVYGTAMAWLAWASAVLISYVALVFLCNAMLLRKRALMLSSLLRSFVASERDAEGKERQVGLWPPEHRMTVRFARTPAVARIKDAGLEGEELLQYARRKDFAARLSNLRNVNGPHPLTGPISAETRVALYTLFASEVSQIRWATFSSIASALSMAAFAYMFPVSGANALIVFNLVVLAVAGVFAGLTAMSLERDELMSNVLCNRGAEIQYSVTLFNYIVAPFLVLVMMIAIIQVPGVMGWGEDLLGSGLSHFGSRMFDLL